jgi:hypothetical protein
MTANGQRIEGDRRRIMGNRPRYNVRGLTFTGWGEGITASGPRPDAIGQRGAANCHRLGFAARRFGNWYAGQGPPYLTV